MCNLIWDKPQNKFGALYGSLSLHQRGRPSTSVNFISYERDSSEYLVVGFLASLSSRRERGGHHLNSITTHTYLLRKDPYGPLFAARPSSSGAECFTRPFSLSLVFSHKLFLFFGGKSRKKKKKSQQRKLVEENMYAV